MAGDTRATPTPHDALEKTSSSPENAYENFNISAAKESSNGLPWSAPIKAGGNTKNPTLSQALMTIKVDDFKSIHQRPCVRESLLVGIGVGFGAGGIRASLGAPILKACSWAVGSFCFGSWIMFEFCQRKRHLEKQGLKRVVDVVDRKRAQKQMKGVEDKTASISGN